MERGHGTITFSAREAVEMVKQESFKKRIRARMETTGERYAAARRVLIEKAGGEGRRVWVAEPDLSDDAVNEATGRGWDAWCDLIEAWPGRADGHTAIAAHLRDDHGVDAWWAQGITVGYERILGLRLPYQRPDGTFTATKSKTVTRSERAVRDLLSNEASRLDMFPGEDTEIRSKPEAKSLRIRFSTGSVLFSFDPKGDDRCKVTVTHERIPSFEDVGKWKFYWTEWLEAVNDTGASR